MVGSLGRLGVLISASFKVFPAPPATATLHATLPSLEKALAAMAKLMGGPYDLEALDLLPQADESVILLARIGGPADVLVTRLERLRSLIGTGENVMGDNTIWAEAREFAWADSATLLVKVATTLNTVSSLDSALRAANAQRRYAVGGNLAWIAWPHSPEECHQLLLQQGRYALVLRGESTRALIGAPLHSSFLTRVRSAFDPTHRFVDLE
jgi:glycolate oxidase FAD binding subunit